LLLRSGRASQDECSHEAEFKRASNFEDKRHIGKGRGQESMKPNSRPMTLIGAHRLWSPSMIHLHLWREGSEFLTARAASSGQIGLHAFWRLDQALCVVLSGGGIAATGTPFSLQLP
jgi:hypothetical protein